MAKGGGGARGAGSGAGSRSAQSSGSNLSASPQEIIEGFAQWENFAQEQGIDLATIPPAQYEGRGLNRRLIPFTNEQEIASSIQVARDAVAVARNELASGRRSGQLVIIRENGRVQGIGVLSPDSASQSIYINRIATAPWNHSRSTREASGVGRRMVSEAVQRSLQRGFNGRVTTNPVGNSEGFYRRLGFERLTRGSSEMTLTPSKARELL